MAEDRILAVRFDDAEAFRREYVANIANGGIFAVTLESVNLQERVCIGIELAWCSEVVMLPGEVVHVVPPELAPAGVQPGVAVQFDLSGAELRARVARYLEPGPAEPEERPASTDRRSSSRGTARVPALLRIGDDELIDGRTRNLSRSGLLFSVDGDALDERAVRRGLEVTLFLKHPRTLEDMVIPGRIVRRLTNAHGRVRALAVQFAPFERLDASVREFLVGLRQREHALSLGAVRGELGRGGCAALLERFARSVPEGTLILTRGAEEGFLSVREGCLVGARLGSATDRKALVRLLSWERGRYELQTRLQEGAVAGEALPLEASLLDAAREVDELRRLRSPQLPPEQRLVAVAEGVAALEPDKLESAVLDLASVGQPIGRLVEIIPESDLLIYAAIDALVERGALALAP